MIDTKPTSLSLDMAGFKGNAVRGALWVTAISAASIPLTYFRSWILGQTDGDGVAVGALALILLFINMVSAFVLFGGITVVANYLPKLDSGDDKKSFLATYGLISCVPVLIAILLVAACPELLPLLLKGRIDQSATFCFLLLIPVVVAGSIANYAQAGLMDFRSSALISQLPTLVTSAVATVGFFFFPMQMAGASLPILACCCIFAYLLMFILASLRVFRQLGVSRPRLFLPTGFWKYASFVHLNTITPFIYGSMDQLFVLSSVGVEELGAYFVMLQMANFCSFVPGRISQVMLASFSRLNVCADHQVLTQAYQRLCRLTVASTTLLVLLMVFLSPWLAGFFGPFFGVRYRYLIILATLAAVGSVGTINSMLIMAKERTGQFLVNNIMVVAVQFLVTFLLIREYGVFAVIAGRAAASCCGQAGNFSIIRWGLSGVCIAPPIEYWLSLLVVLPSALVALFIDRLSVINAILLLIVSTLVFLVLIRFRISEIFVFINRQSGCRS
jgi:O-antigen/teichoic acid export membrane protein